MGFHKNTRSGSGMVRRNALEFYNLIDVSRKDHYTLRYKGTNWFSFQNYWFEEEDKWAIVIAHRNMSNDDYRNLDNLVILCHGKKLPVLKFDNLGCMIVFNKRKDIKLFHEKAKEYCKEYGVL